MLGRHPVSGKEIKILKTDTYIHKDRATLVWVRNETDVKHCSYKQFRTLITDITLAKQCLANTYAFIEPSEEILSWLKEKAPRKSSLYFLSQTILDAIGVVKTKELQNVIPLSEFREIYSYLELPRDNQTLACVVAAVGALCRKKHIYGFYPEECSAWSEYRDLLFKKFQITCYEQPIVIPKCWLIQQYYIAPQNRRARELELCLRNNLENPLIDHILLLNESDLSWKYSKLPNSGKIQQIVLGKRLTYKHVMEHIVSTIDNDAFVIFSNSDIYFDDSLSYLWELNMENKFLSLLRYEDDTKKLFGPRSDSQDSWIVSARAVQERSKLSTWSWDEFDFPFGKAGCDNALNIAMLRQKFLVANPAISIKTWHVHASAVRNYDPKDVLEKPFFLYVEPTGIQDLQLRSFTAAETEVWSTDSYISRSIQISEKQSPIFYSMLPRDTSGPWLYTAGFSNIYEAPKEHLYTVHDAFMTPQGFVYDYHSLMMGKNPFLKEECSKQYISHITPTYSMESLLAAPLSSVASSNPYAYCVEYISKILRLRAAGYKGTFWMPRAQGFDLILQQFTWSEDVMPVLPHDSDMVGFGKTVHMLVPSATRKDFVVHKEDIFALRKACSSWNKNAAEHRVTIVLDGFLFKEEDIPVYQKLFQGMFLQTIRPEDAAASTFRALDNCSLFISVHGFKNLYWILPMGARIVEFQKDLDIHGDSAHMAGACDCPYRVILMSRGQTPMKELEEIADEQRVRLNISNMSPPSDLQSCSVDPNLPVIIIPSGFEGFHAHTGDSFREMAIVWAERGYCHIERRSDTPFCWFGFVGDVLLYDRPTWTWFHKEKPAFRKMLCGNPSPKTSGEPATHTWSFWPRRPRLVELLVIEGIQEAGFEERSKTLVFYGRVENNVQKTRRDNKLPEACDDFYMPISVGKEEAYKFSQEEYLRQLANARFGLCLAGFGSKCHREIECMSMGCVPVVAPDVDMTHYVEPPLEGIHYLRLTSFDPEEARSLIAGINKDQWKLLSDCACGWWLRNCSAEGMWERTKSLVE